MSDASVRNFCSYACVMAFQSQFTAKPPSALGTSPLLHQQQQVQAAAAAAVAAAAVGRRSGRRQGFYLYYLYLSNCIFIGQHILSFCFYHTLWEYFLEAITQWGI